jgi:hypothetical protein
LAVADRHYILDIVQFCPEKRRSYNALGNCRPGRATSSLLRTGGRVKLTPMVRVLAKVVALITPKRRWAQFSVGTMFVAVTIMCVWLADEVNRGRRQREVVEAIRRLHGEVKYASDQLGEHGTSWHGRAHSWNERDIFDRVVEVRLATERSHVRFGTARFARPLRRETMDEEMSLVGQLTSLESLNLDHVGAKQADLKYLRTLSNLRELD